MKIDRKVMYAREALKLAKCRLKQKLPALGMAVGVPEIVWTEELSGTDAAAIFWNADEVLDLFRKDSVMLQRAYLHLVIHGLYLHPLRQKSCPARIWWLACDLMTEYRIDRMNVEGFERPIPAVRSRVYRKLREDGIHFTENSLAGWLLKADSESLDSLEQIFRKDNHEFWRNAGQSAKRTSHCASGDHKKTFGPGTEHMAELVRKWRTAFEQIELHEEEHRRQAGGSAGGQEWKIVLEKERGYDYRQFLKRFAVDKEERILDMSSFDYIPYDYSRRMYENLVFLEPLEYSEVKKLEEFVIAIDTSGSCSGDVVRQFLSQTWEILQEKENFFRDMRIHLIQCDCLIQEHVCVTCEEEWKYYLEHMTVKGHGDTDFTPVFCLVDRMIETGELKRLKGLLYFTDGDGIYPSVKPAYETAFVFLNDRLRKGKVPAWALTLTLDREVENKI